MIEPHTIYLKIRHFFDDDDERAYFTEKIYSNMSLSLSYTYALKIYVSLSFVSINNKKNQPPVKVFLWLSIASILTIYTISIPTLKFVFEAFLPFLEETQILIGEKDMPLRRHGRSLTDESVYHKRNDTQDLIVKTMKLRKHKLRRAVSNGEMICVREPADRARFQVSSPHHHHFL